MADCLPQSMCCPQLGPRFHDALHLEEHPGPWKLPWNSRFILLLHLPQLLSVSLLCAGLCGSERHRGGGRRGKWGGAVGRVLLLSLTERVLPKKPQTQLTDAEMRSAARQEKGRQEEVAKTGPAIAEALEIPVNWDCGQKADRAVGKPRICCPFFRTENRLFGCASRRGRLIFSVKRSANAPPQSPPGCGAWLPF